MPKLNWKRLAALCGAVMLLILLVRGCLFACSRLEPARELPPVYETEYIDKQTLKLYIAEEKETVTIGLEEYLVGVVAAEMPASFHVEALKAQAVAARTYALRRIQLGGCGSGADICSSSGCCQAYDTDEALLKKWGVSYEENVKKVRDAVMGTAGKALYYDGELIEALYHASSGGRTEDSENVFAYARPYLRGVESKNEVGSTHITDEEHFTLKAFAGAINKAWPKAKVSANRLGSQVEVTERFSSGRVKTVRLNKVTATGREFRGALELRSAWFTLELSGGEVIVTTRGYGHGVGMSQTGANGMAQENADYEEILFHYYQGAAIVEMSEVRS